MTVAELIEELKKFDSDMEVAISGFHNSLGADPKFYDEVICKWCNGGRIVRLIDANEFERLVYEETNGVCSFNGDSVSEVNSFYISIANNCPTVEERKKGKWEKGLSSDGVFAVLSCSECDEQLPNMDKTPYCPHCGAEMEVENESKN